MTITSLTLHFFEPGPLALLFPRQKKKNPQPVAGDACGDDWHDAVPREFLHEQISKTGLHSL